MRSWQHRASCVMCHDDITHTRLSAVHLEVPRRRRRWKTRMPQTILQLKRTLRELKQLEMTFRFGREPTPNHPPLVWEVFFSTKPGDSKLVKYPLSRLISMEHDEFKAVIDEYFLRVYFLSSQNQDVTRADVYDAELLAQLGLPPHVGMAEI